MRIAVISTYTHPTRLRIKEPSIMQSAVPELIAGLCPEHAQVEIFNEKEMDLPLDRHWDLVFFSYLHSYYEHTKVLSTLFRQRGMTTVAGGRHANHFPDDAQAHFDAVITGEPESNVPALIADFEQGRLQKRYALPSSGPTAIRPYRYELIDFEHNKVRLPGIEASRGCPFRCNFCVLTGHERYRYRPVAQVVDEIQTRMRWNPNYLGLMKDAFIFLDNNLGGSPKYLRELCEALIPLKKTWGCALTFNVLKDESLVKLMAKAGCRYVYTGLESLNPESIKAMNKGQNTLSEVDAVIRRVFSSGILLSFGLIVGSDGDTNEYLEKLPMYLSDLGYFSVTFLGIVCPYPETPFFRELQAENRLLPGTLSRDYDGYTLCHRPKNLHPSEVIEHFHRLCGQLGSLPNLARHYWSKLTLSNLPRYKQVITFSGPEILSIRNPLKNPARRYIAGLDALEDWDTRQMAALGLKPQQLT
ncbi:B12-binding domain-containing radical SAM protein [Myxococcus sp. K38C18041901]|uniref:B12-binding domain-containing radical SAM protein n=1 Tax=Myxococcus guangdongensis TaxID=2906760 RepID=UPI0020A72EFA|nr:radical SAM protein [Myxococcus guangdongensis]MCP3064460.1 B12-binding domain-containing radical SAM protein [Myxococcus guangdongensis]